MASTAAFLAAANLKHLSIVWPFLLQKSQVSSLDSKDPVGFSYLGGLSSLFRGPGFPVMKVLPLGEGGKTLTGLMFVLNHRVA